MFSILDSSCASTPDTDIGSLYVMDTLSSRLKWALSERQISQSQLARECGLHRATVSLWVTGQTAELEGSNLAKAAEILRVNPMWLATGKGRRESTYGLQDVEKPIPNVSDPIEIKGGIPLISWVQAGTFCQVVDLFEPGDAEEWLPSIHGYGPHAYALRVDGDSMVNPNPLGKTYPPGCVVFVDPDVALTNGARVIAKIPGSQEATFKVFVEDAGRRYLRPLNPAYPTIDMTEDMLICGVVVGKFERE